SAEEPENTLRAFESAVELGADAVEFDVRMSADGHAVVMHDPVVDRTTDGHGLVREQTLAELKRLRVRSSSGSHEESPTLAETMRLSVEGGHGWLLPAAASLMTGGEDVVSAAHGAGLRLGTWIVDDPEVAALLATWSLDAIATNDPRAIVPAVAAARRH